MPVAKGVPADRDIEIVGQREQVRAARASQLRAAGGERVQHEHGGRCARWRERHLVRPHLHAQLVVERLADRARPPTRAAPVRCAPGGSRAPRDRSRRRRAFSVVAWLRCSSARNICDFDSACSSRAVTFRALFGLRMESAKYPDGSAATMVFVSNASVPSTETRQRRVLFPERPVQTERRSARAARRP